MNCWHRLIAALAGLLAIVPVCAQDAGEWLRRLQQAQGQRNYEGVVIYVHDGRIDQIRVVSRAGIEAFQRFASLTGNQRELLRAGGEVRALSPSQPPLAWPAMAATLAPIDLEQIARLYHVQLTGSDRVAGFSARMLEAEPQDGLRYGQRLWIDQESGMLLGAALIGPRKQMLEQVMFAQLAFEGAVAPDSATPAVAGRSDTAEASATLLPGFALISARTDASRGLEQRIYSDGLATVSVYVEHREGVPAGEFATRRGAVQLYGRQLGASRIVAVGAVPPESARRFVEATVAGLKSAQ